MPRSLSAVVLPGDPLAPLESGTKSYIDAALATKASDSAVVHLTGTETIGGAKTFNTAPQVPQGTLSSHPVRLDDPALTNARTPTSHAASHAAGGSDPLTGYAPTASPSFTGTVVAPAITLNGSDLTGQLAGKVGTGDSRLTDTRAWSLYTVGGEASGQVPTWNGTRYVPTSPTGGVSTGRQLLAGTGLTGGGDLSADRTFNVVYGVTAGTAAQGNDVRIASAEQTANKAVANGYASLDATTKVPFAQLPTGTGAAQVAVGSHTHSTSGGYASGTVASGGTQPVINHNLGTTSVAVIIREVSTGLIVGVAAETVDGTGTVSTNNVRLTFSVAPTAGQYSYLILAGAPTSAQVVPVPPSTLVDAATIATDASLSTHFRLAAMAGDRTLGIPTSPTDGQRAIWELTADATQRVLTLTQGSTDAFEPTTSAPNQTLTVPASKTGFVAAVYSLARRRWSVLAACSSI